ncbi:hypothetical protein LINGRAHAP2_LOCUS35966 [Linum grandiflorum]
MATSLSDLRLPRTEERTSEEELLLLPPPHPISKLDGQDDVLLEILSRALTDPGSAARSKSVCKNWNSLISNPQFVRGFINHQQRRHIDETLVKKSILTILPPMDEEELFRLQILGREKDLTLCSYHRRSKLYSFVCNHYTKQLVAVPPPVDQPYDLRSRGALSTQNYCILVCNPRREHQFRVLLLHPRERKLKIFCSESKNWTDCEIVGLHSFQVITVWNGKLYWLDSKMERVVVYNPYENCEPSSPPSPPRPLGAVVFNAEVVFDQRRIRPSSVVRVSRGDLHVVRFLGSGSLSVWRLDDDSEEWRMLYEAVYSDELAWRRAGEKNGEALEFEGVIGLHPEHPEVVFLEFWNTVDGPFTTVSYVVMSCDLLTGRIQRVMGGPLAWKQPRFDWPMVVHNYNKLPA